MTGSQELSQVSIVVVGAGAVGSALTYRLAQAGASVTLVESAYPGAGTSGNSFAWVNAFGKEPRDYYRLNLRSIRDHQDLQDELNGRWLTRNGAWHWADETGANYCSDLPGTIKRLRSWGARVESLEPGDVRALEPALDLGPEVNEVYLIRDEGWLQASLMIQSLLSAAREQYGAKLVRDRVTGLSKVRGAVDTVHLGSGDTLGADLVVVAAGPGTNQVAELVDTKIPLEYTHGFFAVTQPGPVHLQRAVIAPRVIARPDGGGRLILGAESVLSLGPGEEISADSPQSTELMQDATAIMPDLQGVPIESMRHGVRVVPADGLPVVGWDPGTAGVYYAVTHSGITLSAGLANLVVEDLLASGSETLEPYRLERFHAYAAPI